ncbi:DNA-protecting protein DprA [Paenibacillus sp. GSMTC-2017]|uniref:DNA-processing protein DprA n=1 Tax=Paenibacillus sp. GSMTC-2017 TaxID=2794350 RepID=UPI0018D5FB29|nr:DNA-processing protein DprA [Paenibacillus sp. GSMTC-2017]MBH5316655.1 DNA-protecting protein DprA [Paenibacillus sp. GSMTC-2017]
MDNNEHICRRMIIAFYELPGIGWHAIDKAVRHNLWLKESWTIEDLTAIGLRRDQAAIAVELYKEHPWKFTEDTPINNRNAGSEILTPFDDRYPEILRQIAQPPWVLYARGRLELLNKPAIAIVGTRVPTAYGRHTASLMAEQLSAYGITVVSGLAKGVDSRAHEAALEGAGGTIAVMPTPIDTCYPPENDYLFRKIAEKGLLLSETPFGTPLHRGQFHQRNRIIAALSRATIVVEGERKSGSLITAKHAMEMNRELFAVPGPISSPKSEGPNELIREGKALLISEINQIFTELPWLQDEMLKMKAAKDQNEQHYAQKHMDGLEPEECKLITLLRDQPLSINELHELSSIPFGHLNALLLNLCIKRKIELQPGSIYIAL